MGRMLEALRKVGTTPDADRNVFPLSNDGLDAFDRRSEPARTEGNRPDCPRKGARDSGQDRPNAEDAAPTAADRQVATQLDRLPPGWQQQYRNLAARILSDLQSSQSAATAFLGADQPALTGTMLADLASALAEQVAGQVVVVDAFFRRPRMSQRFGIEAKHTILEVLSGAVGWQEVLRPTSTPRLNLLPGSHLPPGQPLPTTFKFGRLLGQLREHFDLVLIGAAWTADRDTQLPMRHTDGVYLVVEPGRTLRRTARNAVRHLERRGIRVLGCVLIESDEKEGSS